MNIEILTYLRDNSTLEINKSGSFKTIRGISETEITQIEQLFNIVTLYQRHYVNYCFSEVNIVLF